MPGSVFGKRFEFEGHKYIVVAEIAEGFVLAVKADDDAPAPIYLIPEPRLAVPDSRRDSHTSASPPPEGNVRIWTHGTCLEDRGAGGWAYVRQESDGVLSIASGSESPTTPDRIKLRAVIEALTSLTDRAAPLVVYSDFAQLIESMAEGALPETDLDLWEDVEHAAAGLACRWALARAGETTPDHDRWTKMAEAAATRQAQLGSGCES